MNLSQLNATWTDIGNRDSITWPGAVMIIYSTFLLIAYILCMFTIMNNEEKRKLPVFRIILHIGIADVVQLFFIGIVGGAFSLCQSDYSITLNKIVGGIMNSNWVAYSMMGDLLAWNRFVQTYYPGISKRIFSMRNVNLMLAACWAYGLAWFITYMCPDLTVKYNWDDHYWDYDQDQEKSRTLGLCELSQDVAHIISMIIAYAAIFFKLAKQAKQIANSQLNADKKERLVLFQSIWICATDISGIVWFFSGSKITTNHWGSFFSTMVWLTSCGSNGLIYFVFNKNIRREVKELMKCGNADVVVSLTSENAAALNTEMERRARRAW